MYMSFGATHSERCLLLICIRYDLFIVFGFVIKICVKYSCWLSCGYKVDAGGIVVHVICCMDGCMYWEPDNIDCIA
jgi:hypothetical protein